MGPDDTIGHYRITAKLGQGGMGAVYRAMDTKLQREVAIKVIPEEFARDHDRLARFTREAQILAGLNHPNIAAIYGVEGRALILELVEGPTLSARIKQGPIPVDEALPLIHRLIDALQYAHEKGVIHRDLKPSNIKISLEGCLKVLDFGLARMAQVSSGEELSAMEAPEPASASTLTMRDKTSDTATGMIMGTASYMSPEQARGQSADSRADIWAFGAIVYEMTTGHKLFKGPTVSDTLAAVLVHEPDFDSFPPQLRRLGSVCLSRDPHHRLQAIGDARLLLEETPAPVPPARVGRPVTWMLASVVFAIIAILGGTLWRSGRPVDHPLVRLRADLGPEALPGANLTAAIAPDGDRIAFVARAANGASQLATRLLNQPKPALLAGTELAADPFFSPDGRWIGFFAGGKLKKISVIAPRRSLSASQAAPVCAAPPMVMTAISSPRSASSPAAGYPACPKRAGCRGL
jgi:serine/threonine-protein kinase